MRTKGLLLSFVFCSFLSGLSLAALPDVSGLCLSAPELRKTFEFLQNEADLALPIPRRLEIAKEVSMNCAGSFERFAKTYVLMKKSGVDLKQSLKTALFFAKETPERFTNFFEFFQMSYLREKFDLDFERSFEMALSLSKDFVGNAVRAKSDFEKTVDFCQAKSGLDLPIKKCAEISLQVTRISGHFPTGSYAPFEQVYRFLRHDAKLELSMKEALETALLVMNYGPMAPPNFRESFQFATDLKNGLGLKSSQALQFSIEQARASSKSATLPVYE